MKSSALECARRPSRVISRLFIWLLQKHERSSYTIAKLKGFKRTFSSTRTVATVFIFYINSTYTSSIHLQQQYLIATRENPSGGTERREQLRFLNPTCRERSKPAPPPPPNNHKSKLYSGPNNGMEDVLSFVHCLLLRSVTFRPKGSTCCVLLCTPDEFEVSISQQHMVVLLSEFSVATT